MKINQLFRLPIFALLLGLFALEGFAADPILIGLSITRSPPGSVYFRVLKLRMQWIYTLIWSMQREVFLVAQLSL
jgi:hypothetical protein